MQRYFGPSRVTANKGFGLPIWKTVYISKVGGARKVMSNWQVADPVQKNLLRCGWGGQCPQLKFIQTSGIYRKE